MAKIAALVSGGVDSSVALNIAKEKGHDITAFYLKIWLEDEFKYLGDCPWEEDLEYVEKVCAQANIPLQIINLQKEYWNEVVTYAINEVKEGRTPNPDIMCNSKIKFGAFVKKLTEIEKKEAKTYEKIITGHYADSTEYEIDGATETHLKLTPDSIKDQTYFLADLNNNQLRRAWFPLGKLTKDQVRAIAKKLNLPNKYRKDSQGICFLGEISWKDFLKEHLGEKPGKFLEYETKEEIGTHDGYWFYTIGQRTGLGLSGGPWYIVEKDKESNTIYISRNYDSKEKNRNTFWCYNPRWTNQEKEFQSIGRATRVKLRHGPNIHNCKVEKDKEGIKVQLSNNDQGIATGQFAVFYTEDGICLGSGSIDATKQEVH